LAGTIEFVHIEQISALFKFRLIQVSLYMYVPGVTRNPFSQDKFTRMEYISCSDLEDMDIDLEKRAKFCLPSWIVPPPPLFSQVGATLTVVDLATHEQSTQIKSISNRAKHNSFLRH
jgi:hypothetical protein